MDISPESLEVDQKTTLDLASEETPFKILDVVVDCEHQQAPSHSLPAELLSEIFILAIPTRKFVTTPRFPFEESDYKITFALSQTCRYWRTVALATTQIWSSISVIRRDSDRLRPESDGLVAFTKMFIERSSSVPLHITIVLHPQGRTQGPLYSFPPLLDLIFSQAYRWKSAIIHFQNIGFEIFPELKYPILDSLNYKQTYPYNWRSHPNKCTFTDAPSLRHVIFDGPQSQMPVPWSQLRSYVGLPVDREGLQLASSQLQTCVFRGPLPSVRYSSKIILFPNLTSLRIIKYHSYVEWSSNHGVPTLCQWIAAPVLENLEIRGWYKSETPSIIADLLLTTLTWPSTTLRSISFHGRGLTEQDFKKLVYAAPCLTTLDICDVPASVVACLDVRATQTPNGFTEPLAPRLQSLTIRNFSPSNVAALWAVYDSRNPPLNAKHDDMKIARLNIMLSYRSFRACHQAQCRIEEVSVNLKGLRLGKILGWCNHLIKQFLVDLPEKKKRYPLARQKFQHMYSPRELDIFFTDVIEKHKFSDPTVIEISRIARIMSDIRDLPPIAILDDNEYKFRQRAGKVLESWTPLLEDLKFRRQWTLGEDYLTLTACGPGHISGRWNTLVS